MEAKATLHNCDCISGLGDILPDACIDLDEPRNVIGFELKESYHKASLAYIAKARKQLERGAEVGLFAEAS